MLDAVIWFIVIEIIGLASFPFCYYLFPFLKDRGYCISKPIGILILGYFVWLLSVLDLLPSIQPTIIGLAIVFIGLSFFISYKKRMELKLFITENVKLLIVTEAIFIFFLLFWVIYKTYDPSINHTEQPMDFGFFNASIRSVYGHPQALAQCRKWLSKNLPRAKIIETESSAKAAQVIKNKSGKGSIGPKQISEIYSLNLLKEKIQDQITNTTRFLVIGNEFPGKTSEDKTSISLSLKNEQGALLKVLQIVNKNKINLTNILSRPVKKNKWQYSFFLEFSGHASDKNVLKLFKELQRVSYDLKVLGSYPAAY